MGILGKRAVTNSDFDSHGGVLVTPANDSQYAISSRTSVPTILAAMLLWGSWCFLANADAPWLVRSGLSLAQALASGVITWGLSRVVALAIARWGRQSAARWVIPLCVVAVTGSALWLLHLALGTPELARTIIPPIIVAWSYCQWLTWRSC